ncbi:MAG: GreA/GreB family elongation factor [Chloroflexi bacterium]|nr:GreA/GreB family elongation factor [Chloroflexota bacterium]
MTEGSTTTLTEAADRYLKTLADDERLASRSEVHRFVRWCGADRTCDRLRGQEVANYAETLSGGVTDPTRRAEVARAFLAFAKKAGYTSTNLGTHLRLRKKAGSRVAVRKKKEEAKQVRLTEEDRVARAAELESLKAQRPLIQRDMKRAMEDKDFRENAPLDAVRQQKAFNEGRIQELEALLEQAVIVDGSVKGDGKIVTVGSTVELRNLASGGETRYTLVWPGQVDAKQGRISIESPVGQALLKHRAGDEVEVNAPSGTLRFRIERIEA